MSINRYPAGQIQINNSEKTDIFVTDFGSWNGSYQGKEYSASSRDLLEAKLKTAAKKEKIRVKIAFTLLVRTREGARTRDGDATGLHAGTGRVLVRWSNGDADQVNNYHGPDGSYYTHLTSEQKVEILELHRARAVIMDKIDAFDKQNAIRLADVVENAIQVQLNK